MDKKIDLLRISACFMVILLHVSGLNIHEFGPKWWPANFWDSLTRASVPLFFMVSGSTLLLKREPLKSFISKRASKILLPLIVWSTFYLWWLVHNGVPKGNWVVEIISGPTMYHLWFFYALIGLYLFLPVMRVFYQNSTNAERRYFLLIWFIVTSALPTALAIYGMISDRQCGYLKLGPLADIYHLQNFSGYIGYMVLGAYLKETQHERWIGISLFTASSIGTMMATYASSKWVGTPCEFFFIYFSPLVVTASAGAFMIFNRIEGQSPQWLSFTAGCTLGIYGLHPFIIDPIFMSRGIIGITGLPWIDPVLASIGIFFICLAFIGTLRSSRVMRILF